MWVTGIIKLTKMESKSCNCKRFEWRVVQAPGYDSRHCMWTSLGSFMLWTYATAELLLPVASRLLLQLGKQSRQSESFNVTEKPLVSPPPPFLITVEGSCGLPDPVRCFHGPNVRPLCCCVLLLFLWYNSRIKSVTEIKKKVKSMCWVLISWFCIFYQQQTVVLPSLAARGHCRSLFWFRVIVLE